MTDESTFTPNDGAFTGLGMPDLRVAQLVNPVAYQRVRSAFERLKSRREASEEDWRQLGAAVEQLLSTPVELAKERNDPIRI